MEAPHNIRNYRKEQCKLCPTPCEFQKSDEYRLEGDNACPEGRWMAYKTNTKTDRMRGAGDLVAALAEPVAGAVDSMFKTKLKGCAACSRRRAALNALIPFGK